MMDLDPRLYENVSVSDNDVRDIVLSYLMHNCYKETAETFLSSTGLKLPIDYTVDVDKRKAILNSVLEGDAVKAIKLTDELVPNLLENDKDLHFDILSLHFVELVRSRKCTEAVEFGKKMLTPFGKIPKYVEKLEDFLALLAYEEPEKSPMFHLLSPEYRQNVADSLNRAILANANLPAYSSLERVIQQSTVVRQYLQQEVGKSFGGSNGKNPNPSSAPSALRSITRSVDRNGHRYADGNAGYDMVLAKEQNRNPSQISTLSNKMVSFPSFISDNGTMTISTPERFGPWGGTGGTIFDDGIYTGVRQITITRGLGISSMKVLYDRNGQAIWGDKRGTSGAARPEKVTRFVQLQFKRVSLRLGEFWQIVFDFPTEILTHVTGYFGPTMIMGPTVIKSITFHTTKKSHGPFGDEHGTFFSSCLTDGRIVGFHGRGGWYIDSIGVHVLEGKVLPQKAADDTSPSRQTALALPTRDIGDEVTYGVVKEPIPIGPGPWGGEGGKPWDDGVYTGVKQIYITRNEFIGSIQIEYDRSGQSIWSTRHGDGGQITHRIKLDYPHEVLTCIYGYYNACAGEGPRVLRSITVVSSRGKYGPFGDEVGTYFTSATTKGKVVGFHGRSALYLDAIGVHMQHWLGDRNTAVSNPKTSSNSKAIVSSNKAAAATTTTSSKYYISKYLF